MPISSVVKSLTLAASVLALLSFFQNCSGVHFESSLPNEKVNEETLASCSDSFCDEITNHTAPCRFNGQEYANGSVITAYISSTTAFGTVCQSEERKCNNGQLSGSFTYPTCTVDQPKSCTFNGQMVAHGESVDAFLDSSVEYGQTCKKESRKCENGTLSGSYAYGACTPGDPKACIFNGVQYAHGTVAIGYKNPSVDYGLLCESEMRLCTNGSFNGSFTYGSCTPGQPKACLFNGVTIPHGASVPAFQNSAVAYNQNCVEESRKCDNGNLSGSYSYANCSKGTPKSCLFNGVTVAHGQTVKAFVNSTVAYGNVCAFEDRLCTDGSLSGSYSYPSCSVDAPMSCLFNGTAVAHGQTVKAFEASAVAFSEVCKDQDRLCQNGTLTGTFTFASCTPGQPKSCMFNGQTIAHGSSVVAHPASTVSYGTTCANETRNCYNGTLSGTATYASCTVDGPKACLFNGQTIAHGQNVQAFLAALVPYGNTCTQENRNCQNGTLSGTYTNASCTVDQPKNCTFNGATVLHGASVDAFFADTVPYGSTCSKESRTCENGTLKGSNKFSKCTVTPPKNCTFNGATVLHGASVDAYQSSQVPFGNVCVKESRKCDNNVLSGSFTSSSCTVAPPLNCTFNGATVLHGASVDAYQASQVPFGNTCVKQSRACYNNSLSGTYTNASCSVAPPGNCSFNGATVLHGATVTAYQTSHVPYGSTCAKEVRSCYNTSLSGTYGSTSCSVDPIPNSTQTFTAKTSTPVSTVDILFVVDESVSMDGIIAKVRSGFASITSSTYPSDTKMAVTNMSPAKVTNTSTRAFDASKGYITDSWVAQQPGFIKFVNKSSISSFKSAQPSRASEFSQPGCNSWFVPSEKNSNGVACLTAHTQVALEATHIEAGVITLEQLVQTQAAAGGRTFRSGALANVVFVSDTHDPGGSYYGKSGAASSMLSYSALKDLILTKNSGLLGVKFNGIVPLPLVGDPKLSGLTVVGSLPTTSAVTSEDTNGYSYLDYIKASSGVAMHVTNSNWTAAISKMVSELGIAKNPIVTVTYPIVGITSITVNGSAIAPNEYTISSDRKTIDITKRSTWPDDVTIVVSYTHL